MSASKDRAPHAHDNHPGHVHDEGQEHVHDAHDEAHVHEHATHDHAAHAIHHHGSHTGHDHAAHAQGPPGHTSHHHGSRHASATEKKQSSRLALVLGLTASFFVAEFIGAWLSKSAVLQADALHLLMDIGALGMSLLAMRLSRRQPTAHYTFGLVRAEPLAALFNAALVLFTAFEIVREGYGVLVGKNEPEAGIMLVVAAFALVVNGLSAWLLHGAMHAHGHHGHGHHGHDHHAHDHAGHAHGHAIDPDDKEEAVAAGHQLNLRGAWLHLLGDALGSLAALVAALVIRLGGPVAIDPLASFFVAGILLVGGIRLVRDAARVLLEAAPKRLDTAAIATFLRAEPGVTSLVHLHIWTLGAGDDAAMVRVTSASNDGTLGAKLSERLCAKYRISVATVQVDKAAP